MSCEELIYENNEEYFDDAGDNNCDYDRLKTEYEKCRQENHELKNSLKLKESMLNELIEQLKAEYCEQNEKEISELKKNYRREMKNYDNVVYNLRVQLEECNEELTKLRRQPKAEFTANACTPVAEASVILDLKEENVQLKGDVVKFKSVLKEKEQKYRLAEETIEHLKDQYEQLELSSQYMREQLEEKSRALEDTRAELALRRAEVAALENAPTGESRKGNSLFAEVDKSRQKVVCNMKRLRDQYKTVKRRCQLQTAEIKRLKAEHVAMLKQWEAELDNRTEDEQLIQQYKNRISDLESKLKAEIDKNADSKRPDRTDTSFGLLCMLDTKKKEINEFRVKIEDLWTKLLIQEEAKRDLAKELRFLKYKTSILEAQLRAEQEQEREQELNFAYDANEEELLKESDDSEKPAQSLRNSDSETTDRRLTEEVTTKSSCDDTVKLKTVRFKTSPVLNEEETITGNKENKDSNNSVLFTKNIIAKRTQCE